MLLENDIRNLSGLTENEVKTRLKKHGFNEISGKKQRTIFHIIFEVIKEPMFILLLVCATLYFILGDIQEAIMLLGFVIVIIGISIFQEGKTEKALHALKDLSSPRALVIRDGVKKRIAGKEVVNDDLVILTEGDRVPADGVLIWGNNVTVDESLLTGESIAVRKTPGEQNLKMNRPGGENQPFLFSSTMVVSGQGVVKIKATGSDTEIGKIGKAIQSVKPEKTLLQKETGKIVKIVFLFAFILCASIIIFYGINSANWIKGVLSGLTLAMAMLPEEFPVVLTVFLALGAWRISKKSVLTRKMNAVETLGSASVLCSDKTGTITQNKMKIKKIFVQDDFYDISTNGKKELPEKFHEIIEYGILASQRDPFDPMEKAFKELGEIKLHNTEHLHEDWDLIHQYPISDKLLALSHVWASKGSNEYVIAAKGAPESIADLCHLNEIETKRLEEIIFKMASDGLRILGIAQASFKKSDLPKKQHDFEFEFIGLVGLEDPIRDTVPTAIKECYTAGIRVIMITGDYPATAQNIARQIGLKNHDNVITGTDLEKLTERELKEKVKAVNIFSRVIPEQKLKIVNALKSNDEIVAMTGDGVNDAPALKSSNIGIAMGERGTDVAREASDIVLIDDSFPSIVSAVKQGRQIFDNLRKAMTYIISVHIPIAGASLIPILFKWPVELLTAVHIVFLELIIDPACTIVFEAEKPEKNIMNRNPRKPDEKLFNFKTLIFSVLQGLFSLMVVLAAYQIGILIGTSQGLDMTVIRIKAKTLAFATLIISNIFLILVNRSVSKMIFSSLKDFNLPLIFVVLFTLVFLGSVIYVPFMQNLFHFTNLSFMDIAIAFGLGIVSIIWFELIKFISNRKKVKSVN